MSDRIIRRVRDSKNVPYQPIERSKVPEADLDNSEQPTAVRAQEALRSGRVEIGEQTVHVLPPELIHLYAFAGAAAAQENVQLDDAPL